MDETEDKKSVVPIDPEWFKWVIKKQDSSIRKLGKDEAVGKTDRTIGRAVKAKEIDADLLERIAYRINVHPDYLAGKYSWTMALPVMDEEGVRDYWRDHFLDPSHFPYLHREQEGVAVRDHLKDTLLLHGVSWEEFSAKPANVQQRIKDQLDRMTTKVLSVWFPDCTPEYFIDMQEAMEWQTEQDVYEALLDYLVERGLATAYEPEEDDYDADTFAEKYLVED